MKRIRLTEGDLHQIIKESVNRILCMEDDAEDMSEPQINYDEARCQAAKDAILAAFKEASGGEFRSLDWAEENGERYERSFKNTHYWELDKYIAGYHVIILWITSFGDDGYLGSEWEDVEFEYYEITDENGQRVWFGETDTEDDRNLESFVTDLLSYINDVSYNGEDDYDVYDEDF